MTVFHVSHQVEWRVAGAGVKLPSTMSWTSEDPLAVRVSFDDMNGKVNWVFARDLFADVVAGKCSSSGNGDVRVAKMADLIVLTLSVHHVARLSAEMSEIDSFLKATYKHAPQGEEKVDIDTTIVKLLEGGQGSSV